MIYWLAIDIGASSGRHILGSIQNGKLILEEVYRFENNLKKQNDFLVWDIENLVREVKNGLKECVKINKIPKTVAIDTWGVDYVLLDKYKKEFLPVVSYRDGRTKEAVEIVSKLLPQNQLYRITGIQKQGYNTIYQLYSDRLNGKLKHAKYFLMIPDYLNFKLTGVIHNEYTNATTTNLVNAEIKDWDEYILGSLVLPKVIFSKLSLPSTEVGDFTEKIQKEIGFNAKVIHCPSHDTASAVAACPVDDESVYISSGTWSLIGTENTEPILNYSALKAGFTNEGGIDYRYRFLKNIMGMWLFQSIRRDLGKQYSYDELMNMAKSSSFCDFIDPTDDSFLAPANMIEAVRNYLRKPDLPLADVLSSVYHSLAESYRKAINEIGEICGKDIKSIYIVGGGSKDTYLNELTAKYTGKKVYIGLNEATATGNIISQIMYSEKIVLKEARELIKQTFIKEVE